MKEFASRPVRRHLSTGSLKAKAESVAETQSVIKQLRNHLVERFEGLVLAEEFSPIGRGDLVAIHPDGKSFEYEIKRSPSDLSSELRLVEIARECLDSGVSGIDRVRRLKYDGISDKEYQRLINRYCVVTDSPKYEKHYWYLNHARPNHEHRRFKPNYFYFVTPAWLAGSAVHRLTGTPYGLISTDPAIDYLKVLKPAEPLHDRVLEPDDLTN